MEIEQKDQMGLGNTDTKPKKLTRHRRWCFTFNNYNEDYVADLEQKLMDSEFVLGREIATSGTPHIQGWVGFKNLKSFEQVKDIVGAGAHIEAAKGSAADNYKYCSKDGDFISNIEDPDLVRRVRRRIAERYFHTVWKPWQQEVIDICNEEPDGRTIHWFWEPTGNVGKSYVTKYLACRKGTIMGNGKANDIFNSIRTMLIEEKVEPKIVILDVPRTAIDYINYTAIEKLADGCFASGKYEGAQIVIDHVHIICFANTPPKKSAMSLDRWHIVDLRDPEPMADDELEDVLGW